MSNTFFQGGHSVKLCVLAARVFRSQQGEGAPQKFWFVENPGKIPENSGTDVSVPFKWDWMTYVWILSLFCCDRKSWVACAQSFAPWQQATIEITRRDHSIIACSHHAYIFLFFAHIPFVVNHTINATPPERLQQFLQKNGVRWVNRRPFLLFMECLAHKIFRA